MKATNGFTHKLTKSGLRCKPAPWWPTTDAFYKAKEKAYPMMILETGQVTRVNNNNIQKIRV